MVPPMLKRIASRHLQRRAEIQNDLQARWDQLYGHFIDSYTRAKTLLLKTAEEWKRITDQGGDTYLPLEKSLEHLPVRMSSQYVYDHGGKLSQLIWETREIPKSRVSAFNKAHKAFNRTNSPKNWNIWLYQNLKEADLILEARTWPEKGSSAEVTIQLGPITVINQTVDKPDTTIKVLEAAVKALKGSGLPNIGRVLYGEVFFVGDIERKKTRLALYYVQKDLIQVLMTKRFTDEQVGSLVHEFGHRYWEKFLPQATKSAWIRYDSSIRGSTVSPEIGETILWNKKQAIVQGYLNLRGKMYIEIEEGVVVPLELYLKLQPGKFPTLYSSTNHEEHFCDALSLYCLGKLPEPFFTAFDRIIKA